MCNHNELNISPLEEKGDLSQAKLGRAHSSKLTPWTGWEGSPMWGDPEGADLSQAGSESPLAPRSGRLFSSVKPAECEKWPLLRSLENLEVGTGNLPTLLRGSL